MPLKPRKLDRSARLAPVLQTTAAAGPLRDPWMHETNVTRHKVAAPAPLVQPDTDQQSAPKQQVLRPPASGLTAQLSVGSATDDSSCSSPDQHTAAEAAQQAQLWVPVPAPRIVAVLKALQVRRRHAVEYALFVQSLVGSTACFDPSSRLQLLIWAPARPSPVLCQLAPSTMPCAEVCLVTQRQTSMSRRAAAIFDSSGHDAAGQPQQRSRSRRQRPAARSSAPVPAAPRARDGAAENHGERAAATAGPAGTHVITLEGRGRRQQGVGPRPAP